MAWSDRALAETGEDNLLGKGIFGYGVHAGAIFASSNGFAFLGQLDKARRLHADGHGHFLFYCRLYPWDHAPGWLLHREAGGYSARFDGRPYDPTDVYSGLICAPDRDGWEAVRAALLE